MIVLRTITNTVSAAEAAVKPSYGRGSSAAAPTTSSSRAVSRRRMMIIRVNLMLWLMILMISFVVKCAPLLLLQMAFSILMD